MTFVDTNVFMYAVGDPHPLRQAAQDFFDKSYSDCAQLCTSAEVLQELAHAYLPVRRTEAFDSAMELIADFGLQVWPLEAEDVLLVRQLHQRHPHLSARDLCHLATCQRHRIAEMMTFDRDLAAAFAV